jgi:hypothetical protein
MPCGSRAAPWKGSESSITILPDSVRPESIEGFFPLRRQHEERFDRLNANGSKIQILPDITLVSSAVCDGGDCDIVNAFVNAASGASPFGLQERLRRRHCLQ